MGKLLLKVKDQRDWVVIRMVHKQGLIDRQMRRSGLLTIRGVMQVLIGQKPNPKDQHSKISVDDLRDMIRQEIKLLIDESREETGSKKAAASDQSISMKGDFICSLMQVPFSAASGLLYAVGGLVDSVGNAVGQSTRRRQ